MTTWRMDSSTTTQKSTNPFSGKEKFKFWTKCILSTLLAIPLVTIGAGLCATGFLIFIGLPFLMVGITPLGETIKNRKAVTVKYRSHMLVVDAKAFAMAAVDEIESDRPWED